MKEYEIALTEIEFAISFVTTLKFNGDGYRFIRRFYNFLISFSSISYSYPNSERLKARPESSKSHVRLVEVEGRPNSPTGAFASERDTNSDRFNSEVIFLTLIKPVLNF